MSSDPLKVVLVWHMHQPDYREPGSGAYQLPWTYLHGIKDYTDMAAHLEAEPEARAVVNFAPTLLEQLDDYVGQIGAFLEDGETISDPLLNALVQPVPPVDSDDRHHLIQACLRANRRRMIERFRPLEELVTIAEWVCEHGHALDYLDPQFLADLLVWYHLAWLGESLRDDARVQRLVDKERRYGLQDRVTLLRVIGEALAGIVPRYRSLAEAGQVELSCTPYAHPILPLLIDLQAGREALPTMPLPLLSAYPGGEDRAHWHVRRGLETFRRHFGFEPAGCWPAEGGVSEAAVRVFAEHGCRWLASGEGVLRNSLAASGRPPRDGHCLHRQYGHVESPGVRLFFRDDGLSDLIGFEFADWSAHDAVANLVGHLENIHGACDDHSDAVVSIILDGENAWEHYPENGRAFLGALYARLVEHPGIELTTFGRVVEAGGESVELERLVAGSWVYGTFSTWIGERDKNRGWDLLGAAKQAFDAAVAEGRLQGDRLRRAEHQLAICEGSDWFWWFGDDNLPSVVSEFERLYRLQLTSLYQLIGETPPDELSRVFTRGGGDGSRGGAMRAGRGGG